MARALDEVQYRPAEDPKTAEFNGTAELPDLAAECEMPDEDRTFRTDRHPAASEKKNKQSKTKTMTVAAAIFAAAGLTLFAGATATTELLRMQPPEEPPALTEQTVQTEHPEQTTQPEQTEPTEQNN